MREGQNLDGLLENAAQRVGNEPGSVQLPESLYGAAYRPRDTWMRPPGSRSTPRQRSAAASAAPFAAAPRVSQSQTASPLCHVPVLPQQVAVLRRGAARGPARHRETLREGGRRGCASPSASRRAALPAPRKQALRVLLRAHRQAPAVRGAFFTSC